MKLSNDRKSIFIAVPKTGTQTVDYHLAPYGKELPEEIYHGKPMEFEDHVHNGYSGVDLSQITYYAFYRDPVERFFSAVNYTKMFAVRLRNSFPDILGDVPVGDKTYRDEWKPGEFESLPEEMQDRIRNLTPEQFLDAPRVHGGVWMEQYHYLIHPQVKVLRFSNFESDLRKLIGIFGGDGDVPIVCLNGSKNRPEARTYTPNHYIMKRLRLRYPNDFHDEFQTFLNKKLGV